MDSSASTAAEQANSTTDFIPKKTKKLGGSEKKRYQALRHLKVPSAEAVELAKRTFAELRDMGYKFGALQCKPGGKPVKRTCKRPKEIRSKRSRHDALKKIGVTSNLKQLSRKSFAELKQMGFKFSPQEPGKKPVTQSFKQPKRNAPETSKVNENPIQHPPKQAHTTLSETPTQPPEQQACSHGPIRVGIKDTKLMTDSQLKTLSHSILKKIAGMAQGEGPRFQGYCRKPGWLLITCSDQRSKDWLEELIPSLKPWPEACLEIIPETELPKPNIATVFIPDIDVTMIKQSLSLIRAQNPLATELWKVLHSNPQKGGVILTLSIDNQSVENLQKKGLKAYLGFREVQFRLKGLKAHQSGTGFPASNTLPLDQSLLGTSNSNVNLAPAPNILPTRAVPFQSPSADQSNTSPVSQSYMDLDSPLNMGDKYTEGREVTQNHQMLCSYRDDISRDFDVGTSDGREDFNEDAGYTNRDDIEGDDSYCGEEDIRGDFDGNTSYNDIEDINRGISYSRGENNNRGSIYNGREDIRGDIIRGSSYSDRENNRSTSQIGREDLRADINECSGFSGREDIDEGFCYSGREYINRGASYSGKKDIRGDIHEGSSYNDREDMRGNIHGGNYRGTSYTNLDDTRGDINLDNSYWGRGDIARDINRSASHIGREVIRSSTNGGTSYIGGNISGGIRYSDTEVIRCNQVQQNHKRDINDDMSGFREGRYISSQLPSSTTGSLRDRSIGENIRDLQRGITSFGGRGNGQSHQHSPQSTGIYRDRDIGEDAREINRVPSEFQGRVESQIHKRVLPSTGNYRSRDIVEDIRSNEGTSVITVVRNDSQIPPSIGSYRDRNLRAGNRGINAGTSFRGRGEGQICETSNWGSGINTMVQGYTRGSQGYTAGVMQGSPRLNTQKYTKEYTTVDNQRYTGGNDQGYAKGVNQCYTNRDY